MTTIKGPRTRRVVTFNPTTIGPGEELYINIPKLKPSSCLVPGSLALLFDFKNSNTKKPVRQPMTVQERVYLKCTKTYG